MVRRYENRCGKEGETIMKNTVKTLTLVGALALTLLCAGCSNGNDSSSEANSADTSASDTVKTAEASDAESKATAEASDAESKTTAEDVKTAEAAAE